VVEVNRADLQAATTSPERYFAERLRLSSADGRQCRQAVESLRDQEEHLVAEVRFECAAGGGHLIYRVTLFHELDPRSRHVVSVEAPRRSMGLLGVGNADLRVTGPQPGMLQVVRQYLLAGIEHIAMGYDHIAFLLAVIVPAGGFWPLFAAITAFTLAHSVTLSLAVLGIVTPPVRIVEVLIAASIVYAAAENFFVRDVRRRWRLTFAFGLVHGFGFAAVLREYGMPSDAVGPALAAFNIGVELGQLAILAAAILAWQAVLRLRGGADPMLQRRLVQAVSAAVLVLGLYWLGERLLE
jgi:hypothetical protein